MFSGRFTRGTAAASAFIVIIALAVSVILPLSIPSPGLSVTAVDSPTVSYALGTSTTPTSLWRLDGGLGVTVQIVTTNKCIVSWKSATQTVISSSWTRLDVTLHASGAASCSTARAKKAVTRQWVVRDPTGILATVTARWRRSAASTAIVRIRVDSGEWVTLPQYDAAREARVR